MRNNKLKNKLAKTKMKILLASMLVIIISFAIYSSFIVAVADSDKQASQSELSSLESELTSSPYIHSGAI